MFVVGSVRPSVVPERFAACGVLCHALEQCSMLRLGVCAACECVCVLYKCACCQYGAKQVLVFPLGKFYQLVSNTCTYWLSLWYTGTSLPVPMTGIMHANPSIAALQRSYDHH